MNATFNLKDQGRLEYYLGLEISKLDENKLLIHQTAYLKKILNNFNMSECNPVKTLLPRNLNLSLMDSLEEVDPKLQTVQSMFRATVGSLMYYSRISDVQWKRPDSGFAVTFLSRYLHKAGESIY
jgi:hypothetical protein